MVSGSGLDEDYNPAGRHQCKSTIVETEMDLLRRKHWTPVEQGSRPGEDPGTCVTATTTRVGDTLHTVDVSQATGCLHCLNYKCPVIFRNSILNLSGKKNLY